MKCRVRLFRYLHPRRIALLTLACWLTLRLRCLRIRGLLRHGCDNRPRDEANPSRPSLVDFVSQPDAMDRLQVERTWVRQLHDAVSKRPQRKRPIRTNTGQRLFNASVVRLTQLAHNRSESQSVPLPTTQLALDHDCIRDAMLAWLKFSGADQGNASLATLKLSVHCLGALATPDHDNAAVSKPRRSEQQFRLERRLRAKNDASVRESILQEYWIQRLKLESDILLRDVCHQS